MSTSTLCATSSIRNRHIVRKISFLILIKFDLTHLSCVRVSYVYPDKEVRGTDWCVTQPFPAGGLGGAVAPPQRGLGRSPGGKRILVQMF